MILAAVLCLSACSPKADVTYTWPRLVLQGAGAEVAEVTLALRQRAGAALAPDTGHDTTRVVVCPCDGLTVDFQVPQDVPEGTVLLALGKDAGGRVVRRALLSDVPTAPGEHVVALQAVDCTDADGDGFCEAGESGAFPADCDSAGDPLDGCAKPPAPDASDAVEDVVADVPGPCAPDFGVPCTTGGDCCSGRCVPGLGGRVCTVLCAGTCESDWTCETPPGEAIEVCVPPDGCLPGTSEACASGACQGVRVCGADGWAACSAKAPAPEQCNGEDDDCDGQTDEALDATSAGQPCTLGGVCTTSNVTASCGGGTWQCGYAAVTGYEAAETLCDDLDNDCDGATDEAHPGKGALCTRGTGTCANTGLTVCNAAHDGFACTAVGKPAGTLCDDGDAATTGDACDAGGDQAACVGVAIECELPCEHPAAGGACVPDDGACIIDGACFTAGEASPKAACLACAPEASAVAWTPVADGAPCDDGSACTTGDQCSAGACLGEGAPCDDGLECTKDGCDAEGACVFALDEGYCLIEEACYAADEAGASSCEVCDPSADAAAWTSKPAGAPCDDGNACTTGETCGATCEGGAAVTCDDLDPCTTDTCASLVGCVYAPMDDGQPCGAGLACHGGACLLALAAPCTVDAGCASGHCTDGVCCDEACGDACRSCATGTCAAVQGADDAPECAGGSTCSAAGECSGDAGEPCKKPGDCASGECWDGVCCAGACDGACEACVEAKTGQPSGTCASVAESTDPDQECAGGLACDGAGACGTACGAETACELGFYCGAGGTCAAKKAVGAACATDAQCVAGVCKDGVCCGAACGGACQACAVEKTGEPSGTCAPVADGADPDAECAGGLTCDGAGACRGACAADVECEAAYYCTAKAGGSCALKKSWSQAGACAADAVDATGGHQCTTSICVDGVCCNAACDGPCQACAAVKTGSSSGVCASVPAGTDPDAECAGGLACDGAGACRTTCTADAHCEATFYCAAGTCTAKAKPGTACASDALDGTGNHACASGQCRDGVCCDSACTGVCKACVAAKTGQADGTCANVTASTDLDQECAGGLTCDGAGACRAACTADAQCEANFYCSSTSSGTCTAKKAPAAACAGDPVDAAGNHQCAGGVCKDGKCCNEACTATCKSCATGTCTTVVSADDAPECAGASTCSAAGACLKDLGESCALGGDCASGFCTDGVCCNAGCQGTCQACGASGTCASVAGNTDPAGECAGGLTCDGAGACRTACTGDGQCEAAYYCVPATGCLAKKATGATCTADSQCTLGQCKDGVCCESACGGACKACAAVKTGQADGTCANVTESADPDAECSGGLTCDGAGACRTSCGTDALCEVAYYCNSTAGGACIGKKSKGAACAADPVDATGTHQCNGLTCADGVCCDSACTGACKACTSAKSGQSSGTCANVSSNTDPDQECAGGLTCDGAGACRGGCNADNQCEAGFYCAGATCAAKKTTGTECAANNECALGYCKDGVCCQSSCGASCQACSAAKTGQTNGTCAPVTANTDPDAECSGGLTCDGVSACRTACTADAQCEGTHYCNNTTAGACAAKKAIATACAADPVDATGSHQCSGNVCKDGKCCNEACTDACKSCATGTCTAVVNADDSPECLGTTTCSATGACLKAFGQACDAPAECASGECGGGVCLKALGWACVLSTDCASAFCKGGVCTVKGWVSVSAGNTHTCAVKPDGTAWCWGRGDQAPLGNGSIQPSRAPVRVIGVTASFTTVAAGSSSASFHSCGLTTDGTAWCWGEHNDGQLGNGSGSLGLVPVQVKTLSELTAISLGERHSCALKTGGTVWCWGLNNDGQLGDGTTGNKDLPVQTKNMSGVAAVATGTAHSCALKANGTVWCWGYNGNGQLGDGGTLSKSAPSQVGIASVAAIAAGYQSSCAVKTDGTAWCWGDGSVSPGQVAGATLTAVAAIAVGNGHKCTVKTDGTAWCWGENDFGQLGSGTKTNTSTPIQITALPSVTAVTAGYKHTCAATTDGTAWCWGYNAYGQLGANALPVTNLTALVSLAAGDAHSAAIKSDGTAWAWGSGGAGQLGNGTKPAKITTPVQITGLTTAVTIAGGSTHTCATATDGTLRCWGANAFGQLGDGTTAGKTSPVAVSTLTTTSMTAAGFYHSCAVKGDGTLWCWGNNGNGQLGDGTTDDKTTPVQVTGLATATAVVAGNYHTCARAADGTAWCWGLNDDGQLGDATKQSASTPVQVAGLTGVLALTAGDYHTCAALTGGALRCWGWNSQGQLGDGTTTGQSLPVEVKGPGGFAAVLAAGASHSCALRVDGTPWCWGNNALGQVGDGTTTSRTTPVVVPGLYALTALAAGGDHTCALTTDGTPACWGSNASGELGGEQGYRTVPTPVAD